MWSWREPPLSWSLLPLVVKKRLASVAVASMAASKLFELTCPVCVAYLKYTFYHSGEII